MTNDDNIASNAERDERASDSEGGRRQSPRHAASRVMLGDFKATERMLSQYLVSRIKLVAIMLVVLIISGSVFSAGGNDQDGHNSRRTYSTADTFAIDSIDVQINLSEDGSAQVKETWLMDYKDSKPKGFSNYLLDSRSYSTAELEDLHISENGNELQFLDPDPASELALGSFTFYEPEPERAENSYFIKFRPTSDGPKEMVLQYRLRNFVAMLESDKAVLEYRYKDGGEREWKARSVSVCISMDGRDLSANSLYDGATGFHGYAGFEGTDYRIKTFNELRERSSIVIHLALSPELFESLDDWHGELYRGRLVISDQNDAADQIVISTSFYRICVVAAIAAVLLFVAFLTIVAMHLRRVYGTSHGDDLVLSESSRRHWIRYMSSSLALSIALIGLVFLVANLIPTPNGFSANVFFGLIMVSIFIFELALMIDGLTTLRSLRKRKEKAEDAGA